MGNDDLIGEGSLQLERYFNTEEIIGQVYYQQVGVGCVFFSLQPVDVQYVLKITHVRAELYEDSDWIGRIDPYVEFESEATHLYSTEVLDECGQNPAWPLDL